MSVAYSVPIITARFVLPSDTPIPLSLIGTLDGNPFQGYTDAVFVGRFGTRGAQDCNCYEPAPQPGNSTDPPLPPIWPYNTGDIYGQMASNTQLTMYRDKAYSFSLTVFNTAGPIDLTGLTMKCSAKYAYTDPDNQAVFTLTTPSAITITNAPQGQATVTILPGNTVALPLRKIDLYYDVQYTDNRGLPHTVLAGILTVLPTVTQATS